MLELREGLGNRLIAMTGVTSRREFGSEAFYLGDQKFAALTDRALVIHLPPKELTEAFKGGFARPFVSAGALARHGWVEIPLATMPVLAIDGLLNAAYRAAQHAHRKTRTRKPAAARRVRPTSKATK